MSASSVFRDMRLAGQIAWVRRASGVVASGVADLSDNNGSRGSRVLVIVNKGRTSGAGAIKPKFYHHATVSATASGMTLFASGTNFTASALASNTYCYEFNADRLLRFFGVKISTGTASAIAGVLILQGDLKVSPPSATDDGWQDYDFVTV
jgi:hypothetical protein